jgi:hypothetical protein
MIGFRDKHQGEEIIVVGNGPGLKNIPLAFIESRTNIVLNFFPIWLPFVHADYWMCVDEEILFLINEVGPAEKFVPKYVENKLDETQVKKVHIFEFDKPFRSYTSSIIPACRLAAYMGASAIYVVGFDCTYAIPKGVDDLGRSTIPHFYHDNIGQAHQAWADEMTVMSQWAWANEIGFWNCSIPTKCDTVPMAHYSVFWDEPEQLYPIETRPFNAT